MLLPVLAPLQEASGEHAHHMPATASLWTATLAVLVHSLAMLVTTGAVALAVYQWAGVDFLRPGLDGPRPRLDRGADRHGTLAAARLSREVFPFVLEPLYGPHPSNNRKEVIQCLIVLGLRSD